MDFSRCLPSFLILFLFALAWSAAFTVNKVVDYTPQAAPDLVNMLVDSHRCCVLPVLKNAALDL